MHRTTHETHQAITPRLVLRLAVLADVDPRTARKAMLHGVAAVRGRPAERIADAARELGIALPSATTTAKRRRAA
jgi:hypothetical protein